MLLLVIGVLVGILAGVFAPSLFLGLGFAVAALAFLRVRFLNKAAIPLVAKDPGMIEIIRVFRRTYLLVAVLVSVGVAGITKVLVLIITKLL